MKQKDTRVFVFRKTRKKKFMMIFKNYFLLSLSFYCKFIAETGIAQPSVISSTVKGVDVLYHGCLFP